MVIVTQQDIEFRKTGHFNLFVLGVFYQVDLSSITKSVEIFIQSLHNSSFILYVIDVKCEVLKSSCELVFFFRVVCVFLSLIFFFILQMATTWHFFFFDEWGSFLFWILVIVGNLSNFHILEPTEQLMLLFLIYFPM